MDVKRRVFRAGAVLAVALAAGHLVQSLKHGSPVAARNAAQSGASDPLSAKPALPVSASLSGAADPLADVTGITPLASSATGGCATTLSLSVEPDAMVNTVLTAPCNGGEAVVLAHDGLKLTVKTSAQGIASVSVPAFETEAVISASIGGTEIARAAIAVPEAAKVRRFVLGWSSDDVIDLRVTESDRVFVSRTSTGEAQGRQRIIALGDRTVAAPMMAEVYTYPADPKAEVSIQVEIAVSPGNCGREIVADVIAAGNGRTEISKVSIAVPTCDAAGDILVLNNLAPDLKIAADN